jgi:hypothetical protein
MSRKKKHTSRRSIQPSDQKTKRPSGEKNFKPGIDPSFITFFIVISLLIVISHRAFEFSPLFSRWIIILILGLSFINQVIPSEFRLKLPSQVQTFLTARISNLILIIFISIQVLYGSRLTTVQTVSPIWFGVLLLISITLLLKQILKRSAGTRKLELKFNALELQPVLIGLFLVSTLMTTRNIKMISLDVTSDSFSKTLIYGAIFVLTAFFLLNWQTFEIVPSKGLRIFTWISLILLNLWLAFRNDALKSIDGSYFHVGYYAEVVKSLHSGGTLLYDTPSQYGFLNLLLISWIPTKDSRFAVYIGQAILIFLIVSFIMLVLHYKLKSNRTFLGFSLITIIIFYFADPDLIGPHVYPSSSALRFAPSLTFLLTIYLYSLKKSFVNREFNLLTGFGLFFGALWSAESFIYCASIFGFVHISKVQLIENQKVRNLLYSIATFITAIATALIVFNIYTFISTNHSADLGMHFMYALGYSSGFGSIPLQIASPGWIVIFILSYSSFRARESILRRDLSSLILFAGIVGALLGWFTYFLGRAYPENIIAQFPLIVIIIFLIIIYENMLKSGPDSEDQGPREDHYRFVIPTVVLVSVLMISIVGQPKFVSTLLKTTSITQPNVNSSLKLTGPGLALLIAAQMPSKPLPIVFEGYAGVLPEIGSTQSGKIDTTKTWLPAPLGLLEEPINPKVRSKIISRFIANQPQSGYLLYAVKDSFKDRHLKLMSILSRTHKCTSLEKNLDYDLLLCEKL